jgi:hypothetical protein
MIMSSIVLLLELVIPNIRHTTQKSPFRISLVLIWINDSHAGVSSAVSAGCITVAIPNAYTAKQDLSHAHLKVISFVDVTPTDFLQTVTNLKG